ncbi:relaxase, partial [Anaerotruncus sp. DFI.9.16]|nr:relaxase [Anaerotruncus sp. DFI.9.16]
LKQMAATVTAYQQYGFSSPEELDEACSAAYAAMQESLAWLKQVEKTLNGKKELQQQVLAYSKTRPVRDGLKQQKN